KDAVRIEELINYFDYDYPQPKNSHPFSITIEADKCPWNTKHQLCLVGLKGENINENEIPANNLTFLIDVSGSMNSANKLPLLKQAFKYLVENLRSQDRVAIVVYAGAAGVVLESTSGNQKEKIIAALDMLQAGGSTAGGEGINLAYKIAKQNFIKNGNNRVILASDGDFNVGASSDAEMVRLIEEKRNDGIFLSILGFGMGNYKDSKMEQISNAGNGNYAYIDNILEAKKVFGTELWGTLYTIAKDVKIQIEFNPTKVKAYRLIGYENRILNKEDFNNDKKDAGDIGCGHTVTALYEVIPADSDEEVSNIDPLEYQQQTKVNSKNLMTVKVRYKKPNEDTSNLIVEKVEAGKNKSTNNLMFASAVAEFGMLLRESEFKGNATFADVLKRAKTSAGLDEYGYKADFIKMVEMGEMLYK
ncbi:MAG TPA: von Willebrand factor type A domain-containing protein, partial [Tenuifilaceae bacterium]|nr:von Willebrand factor type A domain-containing protein [Tenuifilaceae bacterium]